MQQRVRPGLTATLHCSMKEGGIFFAPRKDFNLNRETEAGRLKQSSAVDEPPSQHIPGQALFLDTSSPRSASHRGQVDKSLFEPHVVYGLPSSQQNYTHLLVEWIHLFHCEEGIKKFLLKLSLWELSECATHSMGTQTDMWVENTMQSQYITQSGGGWHNMRDYELN